MSQDRSESSGPPPGSEPELHLTATPEALAKMRELVASLPAGQGVRVWVETGIRPQVKMMIDRGTERDLTVQVGGVALFVDGLSRRFLEGAQIQLVRSGDQVGFHVVGPNTPGAPPAPTAPAPAAVGPETSGGVDRKAIEEKIRGALKQIYDPEIPMNLVDLGLIYGMDWQPDGSLTLRMTLTSVGCPSTEQICEEVDRAVRAASGLPAVKVEVVWDPPWTPERMSPFAKRQFGYV